MVSSLATEFFPGGIQSALPPARSKVLRVNFPRPATGMGAVSSGEEDDGVRKEKKKAGRPPEWGRV